MPCGSQTPKSVDQYLAAVSEPGRSICAQLRALIRRATPELTEVIKWSSPCYERQKLVCSLGAFKHHVALFFFRGKELEDRDALFSAGKGNASSCSIKFAALSDIPTAKLTRLLKAAVALDRAGAKNPKPKARRPQIPVPPELKTALSRAPKARAFFESLAPSHQREFNQWILSAKREETKARRLQSAIAMLTRAERRHDKYRPRPASARAAD